MTCPDKNVLIEGEIDRVLTQYRESPNLLGIIRTHLGQIADVLLSICDLPSFFDIDTATGHQLTLIGQRLGWPRCHCVCTVQQPLFGFADEFCGVYVGGPFSSAFGEAFDAAVWVPGSPDYSLAGFCDENSTWLDCRVSGISEICIQDDDMYRGFLKARRYQMLGLYTHDDLTAALQHIWGPTARIITTNPGEVVLAPGRALTSEEELFLQLVPRVLPVALGISQRYHFGNVQVFGFGEGWGGFCDANSDFLCPVDVKPYTC